MAGDDTNKETRNNEGASDHNSPYYLHPSDYPRQMHVNDALTDSNYLDWVQEMENFLFAKNKIGFVDGSIEKPIKTDPNHMIWMRCDALIKGWLTTAMEKEIRVSVKYVNSAAEIWSDLQERFGKESAPRAYELKQSISNTRQDGMTVSSYYTKLRGLWDEIQSFLPTPKCTCNKCTCGLGKSLNELKEKERLYEFLMGLDNEFSIIRTQILGMKPTPSLGNAYHLVAEDEQQRSITGGKKSVAEAAAFQVGIKRNSGPNKSAHKDPKPTVHCDNCDKDGHLRDGCFERIGYPEWWPGKNKREKGRPRAAWAEVETSSGPTKEQYEQFMKQFAEGNQIEHDAPRSANMSGKSHHDDKWIVDSGCTEHMTHREDILEERVVSINETPVTIPNGEAIPVGGKGSHILENGVKIKGVLHVPKFTCNLLSVSKLTKDLNCSINFFPDFFTMQDLRSRKLIGAGKCKGGLYRMGMIERGRKAMMATMDMWHRRLGHASVEKLSKIRFLNNVSFKNNNNICDSCVKSKMTRQPFPISTTKTSACFDLLHCDIWGKYRKPSFSKASYFLTMVDDYSRAVWVFLLKHKHEASTCLVNFHKYVKTQFGRNIKRIRCDNGGEFISNHMLHFYAEQGIVLETTCPHTPQQNGIVERKHRHLLETARALRIEANLPIRFWGECILTAAYVINRLPSKIIKGKTPYELIHDQEPNYDHMRILGCMAYYRNLETKGDKFETKKDRSLNRQKTYIKMETH